MSERASRASGAGERGAVAIIVAVCSVLILGVAAFCVDIGMQRVTRSDMQSVADVVALDMARQLGLTSGTPGGAVASGWDTALKTSIGQQTATLGHKPTTPPSGDWVCTSSLCAQAVPGWVDGNGLFTSTNPGLSSYDAVRVDATASVDFQLHRGSGSATRSAVARAQAGACFSVGSYAARIKLGDDTLLGPLLQVLGIGADIDLLDLQGLADLNVTALGLVKTGVIAGGFSGLLNTDVSLANFYLALADALEAQSGQTAQVQLLQRLASLSLSGLHLTLSQILALQSGGTAGLNAGLNVLDLVMAGAFAANGTNALALPDVNVNLAGLTKLHASVTIAQHPVEVCGLAGSLSATTSQVTVNLSGNVLNLGLGSVAGYGLLTLSAPISISLALDPATASLASLSCSGTDRKLEFAVSSGLLGLGVLLGSTTNDNALTAGVAGIPLVNGYLKATGSNAAGSASETGAITVHNGDYDGTAPYSAGEGDIGLPALVPDSHLKVLGGTIVGLIVNTLLGGVVNGIVAPLVVWLTGTLLQSVDTLLISPLLEALGISVTGADVYARPTADCGYPDLTH